MLEAARSGLRSYRKIADTWPELRGSVARSGRVQLPPRAATCPGGSPPEFPELKAAPELARGLESGEKARDGKRPVD